MSAITVLDDGLDEIGWTDDEFRAVHDMPASARIEPIVNTAGFAAAIVGYTRPLSRGTR